ncbi:hypothetical protein BaRGS_00004006 [Batillaria attramentaria]|uniref:Uncharacterized protein n=1 Tax=Batillaria attramentaria TaxID=370345 RepID=A0ABD0M115_9CAEN
MLVNQLGPGRPSYYRSFSLPGRRPYNCVLSRLSRQQSGIPNHVREDLILERSAAHRYNPVSISERRNDTANNVSTSPASNTRTMMPSTYSSKRMIVHVCLQRPWLAALTRTRMAGREGRGSGSVTWENVFPQNNAT